MTTKPFRTNKEQRAIFAQVLGLRVKDGELLNGATTVLRRSPNGGWYFFNDGYQRTITTLHEFDFVTFSDKYSFSINHCWRCESPNTGEALFHAVVVLGKHNEEMEKRK